MILQGSALIAVAVTGGSAAASPGTPGIAPLTARTAPAPAFPLLTDFIIGLPPIHRVSPPII
jgi:hypothetical protein